MFGSSNGQIDNPRISPKSEIFDQLSFRFVQISFEAGGAPRTTTHDLNLAGDLLPTQVLLFNMNDTFLSVLQCLFFTSPRRSATLTSDLLCSHGLSTSSFVRDSKGSDLARKSRVPARPALKTQNFMAVGGLIEETN